MAAQLGALSNSGWASTKGEYAELFKNGKVLVQAVNSVMLEPIVPTIDCKRDKPDDDDCVYEHGLPLTGVLYFDQLSRV